MSQPIKTEQRVCPNCSQNNASSSPLPISSGEWQVKKCSSCGFVYLENAPKYEELFKNIAWEKSSKVETVRREREHPVQDRISRVTRKRLKLPRKNVLDLLARYAPDGPVIDLGCGNGGYMLQLAARHIPCGIEISRNLAVEGARNLAPRGGWVLNAPALQGLSAVQETDFAAVVMRAYLEHEIHPFEILREAFRVMKRGGILIIKVPNYGSINAAVMGKNWCGIRFPDHVNYFTPESLSNMVKGAGFSIDQFGLFSFRQPTSDNMWMIARKPSYE